MRLTKASLRGLVLPEGKGEAIVFDDALPGFGVRIRAGGKRVFIAQYRVKGEKTQHRVTLGTVGIMGVDEARQAARVELAKVHQGTDPQAERAKKRAEEKAEAALTLGSVVEDFLASPAAGELKPSTLKDMERYLRQHWGPLANLPVNKVTRADVASRLEHIAAKSGGYAANRARAALSRLYGWAVKRGKAATNPVVDTDRAISEVARDRVLSDPELATIWRFAGDSDHGTILRLLALLGQRAGEVGGMTWSEVDLAGAMWRIPAKRAKNGRAHDVPLSPPALALLQACERREGRDLVFGSRGGSFSGWSKCKAALDARMAAAGVTIEHWRVHDLRRSFASGCARLGVNLPTIEKALNHSSGTFGGIVGVYQRHDFATEKRAALELWGAHVVALIGGES